MRVADDARTYFSFTKSFASEQAIPRFLTNTGTLRQPGLLRILESCFNVVSSTFGGVLSIFVTTQTTGTLRARATERCSLLIPGKSQWLSVTMDNAALTDNTSIRPNDQQNKVWRAGRQCAYRGLEVFLVTRKIDEANDFCCLFADLIPR